MKYFTIVSMLLYNLVIILLTGYVVIEYDWSPWWFLVTAMFAAGTSDLNAIMEIKK